VQERCPDFAGRLLVQRQSRADPTKDRTRNVTLKRERQAVAAEIKDGLTERKTVDVNRTSREELAALPGVDHHKADRMIAERPYAAPHPWVSWRVLSDDRYSRIEDRVTVTR
jgi:DNA uptake protein ComE-like DNA-binding protein